VLQPGFSSGHDFSRTASRAEYGRLQPLRDELSSSHTTLQPCGAACKLTTDKSPQDSLDKIKLPSC
jgi:hypothetical protein